MTRYFLVALFLSGCYRTTVYDCTPEQFDAVFAFVQRCHAADAGRGYLGDPCVSWGQKTFCKEREVWQ